jgi:hypothetical protein
MQGRPLLIDAARGRFTSGVGLGGLPEPIGGWGLRLSRFKATHIPRAPTCDGNKLVTDAGIQLGFRRQNQPLRLALRLRSKRCARG